MGYTFDELHLSEIRGGKNESSGMDLVVNNTFCNCYLVFYKLENKKIKI
jgi:hypothetical protein